MRSNWIDQWYTWKTRLLYCANKDVFTIGIHGKVDFYSVQINMVSPKIIYKHTIENMMNNAPV